MCLILQQAFPMCVVTDLRFSYNVEALDGIYIKLREAKSAYNYCIRNAECHPDRHIDVYPKPCSRYCTCICCCVYDRQDGLAFYGKEVEELKGEFEKEKDIALASPLGIAFITFETHQMAKNVYDTFNDSPLLCCKPILPKTTISDETDHPENWKIGYAPPPDDIYWTRLSSSRNFLMIKYVVINTTLFIFLLFLSTPGN